MNRIVFPIVTYILILFPWNSHASASFYGEAVAPQSSGSGHGFRVPETLAKEPNERVSRYVQNLERECQKFAEANRDESISDPFVSCLKNEIAKLQKKIDGGPIRLASREKEMTVGLEVSGDLEAVKAVVMAALREATNQGLLRGKEREPSVRKLYEK